MNIIESLQEPPIIMHYLTIKTLLEQENPADLMAIYMLLSANKHNQLTNKEIMEKLYWSQNKTEKTLKQLIDLKIINPDKTLLR
jgi:predicted component of viral defense system (DUF524 family)